jgi:5'(3')-deoxyribonucleotidase
MQFILEESPENGYQHRTEINAKKADVTIAIALNFDSPGEKLTKSMAKKHNKLYIPVSPQGDHKEKAQKIVSLINRVFHEMKHAIVINIAGNGLYTMKGSMTQAQCDDFTFKLLYKIVNSPELKTRVKGVRSGGQTGFDEAGLKAAIKLKIDTVALYPKNYLIKDLSGEKTQTREEVFKRLGIRQKQKIFVDMDGVLCNFLAAYLKYKQERPEIEFPQSQYAFFAELDPIPGAIESFKTLENHYEVYVLTRPSNYNLHCFTEKAFWIKKHLGFHVLENLIMACDKSIVNGKGHILIDDTLQAGQLDFEGEFIHFGSEKFPDWNTIVKYLTIDKNETITYRIAEEDNS